MDGFRYIEVHKNEESPYKRLKGLLNGLYETNPEIIEGMAELCKSGYTQTDEFKEKVREIWRDWR